MMIWSIYIIIFFDIFLLFLINFTSLKRYKPIATKLLLIQLLILIVFILYLYSSHFLNMNVRTEQYFSNLFYDSNILEELKHLTN